jgi:hypothetical protein
MIPIFGRQGPRLLTMVCGALLALFVLQGNGCATPQDSDAVATPMPTQGASSSGIYGHMVVAFGNPPTNSPPPTECVKVYDSAATSLIARGTCSGITRDFRVPLAPGRYVVEIGGSWEPKNGAMVFVPARRTIEVGQGQWVNLSPPSPPGPVP